MWLGSPCSACLVNAILTVKFLQGKFQPFYRVQYIWSVSIHPNPAFFYALLRRDQMEETHVPLLSKIFWAETGRVLPASAANLPDRLRSDPNSVAYNQLALSFLLFGAFSFLRCTRLVLQSFEVLQWVPV